MPEGERNLRQRIQEQTVRSARDFYDGSLGRLEGILQGDRAQLEDLARQLPEGDAEARIRNMASSYSKIDESLRRAARVGGAEDALGEAARRAQKEAAREPERTTRGARDATGAAAGRVPMPVGQPLGQVGQVAESAQEAVGQVLDRVGHVAENLPGGHLLSRTTSEAGQTLQRAVDEYGAVFEITLDEASNLVKQKPVRSLVELPAEEEYQNQEGQTVRTVREESGILIKLRLGKDGRILDLQVPPSSKI